MEKETITGVACGYITSTQRVEVLFSCFSGAIKSLVDRKQAKKHGTKTDDVSQLTDQQVHKEKLQKQEDLKTDIFKLKEVVKKTEETNEKER